MKRLGRDLLLVIVEMLVSTILLAVLIVVEIIAEFPRIIKYVMYLLVIAAAIKYLGDGNIIIPIEVTDLLTDYIAKFSVDSVKLLLIIGFMFSSFFIQPEIRLMYRMEQFENCLKEYTYLRTH